MVQQEAEVGRPSRQLPDPLVHPCLAHSGESSEHSEILHFRQKVPGQAFTTNQRRWLGVSVGMSSVSGGTPGRREHLFRGRRVKVRDLIDADLLKPGAVLVYDRPQVGDTFQVTVTETGQLQLPDGRETRSPSGAVRQLCAKIEDGWYSWRVADTGELLHALRQRLLEQAVREGPEDGHSDLEARQDEFLKSAKQAAESGAPLRRSVRELIGIWGARVRDFEVNERVDADLGNQGMTTEPDFRAVTLEDPVAIVLTTQAAADEAPASLMGPAPPTTSRQLTLAVGDDEGAWDHGLTIGNLPSASRKVWCCRARQASSCRRIHSPVSSDAGSSSHR